MKNLTTLIFIFLTHFFYGQWVQQSYTATGTLNDIFCITENLVFAVGNNGVILKTTDGGVNWVQKSSGTNFNLNKVQFSTPSVGYAIRNSTTSGHAFLLKTTDSGEVWTQVNLLDMSIITDMSIVNENVFYLTGSTSDGFKLLKTINGGATFQTINSNQSLQNIQFINELTGYGSVSSSLIKTIDGGLNWTGIGNVDFISGNSQFHFIDENIGFKKMNNQIFKTINGGNSFEYLSSISYTMGKIFASNQNIIWGITFVLLLNGQPNYTMRAEILPNGQLNKIDSSLLFKSIHFINPTKGFALGINGEIYKNITGTMLSSKNDLEVKKFKIYPNPTSNQINISLSKQYSETFEIEIIDAFGKKIFSEVYQPIQDVKINTTSFSQGIYFLSILNKETRQTQKVIIQ